MGQQVFTFTSVESKMRANDEGYDEDDRPECLLCRAPLTVEHVLLWCPRHNDARKRHLGYIAPDITLRHILADDSVWVQTGSLFAYILDIRFPVIYSPC